jgi:hypothetical protein
MSAEAKRAQARGKQGANGRRANNRSMLGEMAVRSRMRVVRIIAAGARMKTGIRSRAVSRRSGFYNSFRKMFLN